MKTQQLFIFTDFLQLVTCMRMFLFHLTATEPFEMLRIGPLNVNLYMKSDQIPFLFSIDIYVFFEQVYSTLNHITE